MVESNGDGRKWWKEGAVVSDGGGEKRGEGSNEGGREGRGMMEGGWRGGK